MVALLGRRIQQASAGQMLELRQAPPAPPVHDYLKLTGAKTGCMLALPVELALAAAGRWRSYGRACRVGLQMVGQGYQLVDDIMDGDPTGTYSLVDVELLCLGAASRFRKVPTALSVTLSAAADYVRDNAKQITATQVAA